MKAIREKRVSQSQWEAIAERDLRKLLGLAGSAPSLRRRGPRCRWQASVRMVGTPAMSRLNLKYRGKTGPTDVLSFPAPEVFRHVGQLGELVVCLPVLKRQARELGHSPRQELRVLLVHGLLHLLRMDHERGGREALAMAREERKLLEELGGPLRGLIHRAESGSLKNRRASSR